MDNLQVKLLEESEFTDHNYELIQSALKYWNTYLIDKNGKLFSAFFWLSNYIEQYYYRLSELIFERCKCKLVL